MTEIRLYNTRTRKKEVFRPLDPANVRMYVCGPTVYDRAHIGNARPVIVFDVLFRLLRHVYGPDRVTYVRNFTDVDDKINARAAEMAAAGDARPLTGIIRALTDETIGWYHADMDALGALRPTREPRATDYIGRMVAMIEGLVASGHAYAKDGHVLFRVRSYEDYGQLSGRSVDDMIAGARVEVAPFKEDPMDFVLWKPSSDDLPGWPSPWGRGRPGWHIECSAMAEELLGPTFDIHGGGIDLQFPHHENEIAQSMCAHPEAEFARVWMHNEMLQVEGKKMSKSLGNFFTVRDLLDRGVPGEVIRFVYLQTHYSKPMDWTEEKARAAEATLRKWRTLTFGQRPDKVLNDNIVQSLSDDLNTSDCIFWLHQHAKMGNAGALLAGAQAVGLLCDELGGWFDLGAVSISDNEDLDKILAFRQQARFEKRWDVADRLRNELNGLGVVVRDSRGASSGYIEPSLLMSRLMSDINSTYRDQPAKLADTIEAARVAGVVNPLSNEGPRAWSGREADRLLPYIENKLAEMRKELESLK